MAPSGPVFTSPELKAFLAYVQLFLHAAEVGRASKFDALDPSQRWEPFAPAKAANRLPSRVANTLARYAWHRAGTPTASNAIATDLAVILAQGELLISDAELQGALLAGAYWLHQPAQSLFTDEAGLLALENFSNFMNGYVQTLPPRFAPGEQADSRNRRFRAYQRRRFGVDVAVRSPKAIIRRLPLSVNEAIDQYSEQLRTVGAESAYLIAANLAIALGRPVDDVATAQIELSLATALVWRDLTDFPAIPEAHPILGVRPGDERADLWNAVASRVAVSLQTIANSDIDKTMEPKLVQTPAANPVGDIELDAASLDSLSLLDDYVNAFAGWIRAGVANDIPVEQRVAAFDRSYRRRETGVANGSDVTSELPGSAIKVLAHADALITRQRDLAGMAEELATALGDRSATNRIRRTLEVGAAWLHGNVSRLERMRTDEPAEAVIDLRDNEALEPFKVARQRDAEALLDLGASVTELVRFSQTIGAEGRPPAGWWIKFHSRTAGEGIRTPGELIEHLPDGSARLLRQYSRLLTSTSTADATAAARTLATALGRDSEEMCVRTLAVGLSVGIIWIDLERISRGRRIDTLLGAEPTDQTDRLLVGRAHSQLEWGLQELLHTDSVPGV